MSGQTMMLHPVGAGYGKVPVGANVALHQVGVYDDIIPWGCEIYSLAKTMLGVNVMVVSREGRNLQVTGEYA